MRISLSGVTGDSIVDGPGLRLTIFTQGCLHHCPGCHNPQTHDPEGGSWADTEDILAAAAENPLLDGITLSGGDPFLQPVPCLALAEGAHKIGLNVWTYTGGKRCRKAGTFKGNGCACRRAFSSGRTLLGAAVLRQPQPAVD